MSLTIHNGDSCFFTSDLHFFHKNIIEYSGRPWTYEEQTDEIIKRWNSRVGEFDSVFHLGDFAFANQKKAGEVIEIIKELKGVHHYIGGNHCDRHLWKQVRDQNLAHVEFIGSYLEARIGEDRTKVCMFHYPMAVFNGMHHGAYQLHGHCHGSLQLPGKVLDVGLDNHPDFQVFSWKEVEDHMKDREIHVWDHHTPVNPR